MGLSPLFKSVGLAAAEKLPGTATKAESIAGKLQKAGTTSEEITFGNVGKLAEAYKGEKIPNRLVADMLENESKKFGVTEFQGKGETGYNWVNLGGSEGNASYKEKVITYGADDRFVSGHWPEGPSNYLMHTRSQNDYVNSKRSRVVLEVQSDLHQQGRQIGYGSIAPEKRKEAEELYNEINRLAESGEDEVYGGFTEETTDAIVNVEIRLANLLGISGDTGVFEADNFDEFLKLSGRSAGVPQSPWEKSWLKKGLEIELADAVSQNLDNISVPISGPMVSSLQRGSGVQKWYETTVVDTMKKIAKQQDGTFELVSGKGTDDVYATITLPKDEAGVIKKPQFTLYAAAPATVMGAYMAKQQYGYTDEELQAYLGEDYDDVAEALPKVEQALAAGYSEQEIMEKLGQAPTSVKDTTSEYREPPYGPNARSAMIAGEYGAKLETMAKLADMETTMSMQEIVAALEVVHPNMRSVTLRTAGFFGNKDAARMGEEATVASAQRIVNFINEKYNVPLEYDINRHAYFVGENEVTPGFLDSLTAEGGELTGAVLGGLIGGGYGKKFGGNYGALIGSLGGAVLGSVVGTEIDYIRHAMDLQADMSAEVAVHKALTAAEVSIMGDLVGLGLIKTSGQGLKAMKRVKDFIVDGNSEGAYKALKEILHVTDDEADEYIRRMSDVIQNEVPGSTLAQKRITATVLQKPGAEFLVYAASEISPKAATQITKNITDRATMLNKYIKQDTPKYTGETIIGDLNNYVDDVKNFYEGVKIQAASAPRATDFQFNFDKIAIDPVLSKMQNEITDPMQLQRFVLEAQRIRGMSDARSFGDLLELRSIVNGFRRKKLNNATAEALNDVMTRIDDTIDVGANFILGPEAKQWKANWSAAKQEYSKMKTLEKNVLFKAITRKGIDEDVIANQLIKFSKSVDGTYDEMIAKVPKQSRVQIESRILDKLSDKFTVGMEDGMQAVNFTELDKSLQYINFSDPAARQTKAAIHELAEVFRNDINLVNLNKAVDIPKFQQMLTDSLWGKLKYGIASELYTAVRSRFPGERGRNAALARQAAKWLQEPLNVKEMRELLDMSKDSVDISPKAVQLQQEVAAQKAAERDKEAVLVKLYGPDSVKKLKGIGDSVGVPMHRIASQDLARTIAEQDGIRYTNTAELDFALKQRGYLGIMQGTDRVRMIK